MADGAGLEDEDNVRRLVDTIITEFIEIKRLDLLFQAQRTKWMAHVERWMTHHYSICSSLQLGGRADLPRPSSRADYVQGLKLTPISNGPGAADVSTTDTTDTAAMSSLGPAFAAKPTATCVPPEVPLPVVSDAIPSEVAGGGPEGPHSHPPASCAGFLWSVNKSLPKDVIGAQPTLACRDDGIAPPPLPPPYSPTHSAPGRSLRNTAAVEGTSHSHSTIARLPKSLLSEIGLDCERPEKPVPLRCYPEWDRPSLPTPHGEGVAEPSQTKIEESKVEAIETSGTEAIASSGIADGVGSKPADWGGKAEGSGGKEAKTITLVEAAVMDIGDKVVETRDEKEVFVEDMFAGDQEFSRQIADDDSPGPCDSQPIGESVDEDSDNKLDDRRKRSWVGIDRERLSQSLRDSAKESGQENSELDKPVYDVCQYYYTTGHAQKIARSDLFANITLGIISLNAVYIGVDADQNKAENLANADIGFQICENSFCVFFTFEWGVRFLAFRDKRNCCRDTWFKFDTALVALMVLETWMNPIFFGGASTGLPTGMVKLLRLLRLARMARLMRAFPELVAMIKGVREASRAVGSALMMVLLLIYIFAIIMHMLMQSYVDKDELLAERFQTLPVSMWTLFMDGTLLDGVSITTRALYVNDAYAAFFVLLMFVLMSAMTVMNMLIGVLCEVVTAVAAAEKEDAAIRLVKETVLVMLSKLDEDGSGEISKDEMSTVFDDEAALAVLSSLQVDIAHLVDYLDMYFEQQSDLSIHQIMDLILMLRGDRAPTMRDMLDREAFQRWKLHSELGKLEARLLRCIVPKSNSRNTSSHSGQKLHRS